jgi:glycosyltransferase involved in cell wall biosynthesis
MKKKISIVIPVFNEESNVQIAYNEIVKELNKDKSLNFEIIFTDNHSLDGTFKCIEKIALTDKRVKAIRFCRNYGFNKSILAGYRCASGDAAIQIDCDLEDPPKLIHNFVSLWKKGHDVVVGIRAKRKEFFLLAMSRRFFYKLINRMSDINHVVDGGDFRLIDRTILNQLKLIDDVQPYVRGLISEIAVNQTTFCFTRNRRKYGVSKFPLTKLLKLGSEAIFASSVAPLRIASYVGFAIAFLMSVVSSIYIFARIFSLGFWPAGFATTTVLILFGISLNALFIGLLGEYVARIYLQIKIRPDVIVEKSLNLNLSGPIYSKKEF